MKGLIKRLLRENLISENYFQLKTNIPDYDKLLDGKYNELPNQYSNIYATIEYMSPEQYLRECAIIQDTTYADQLTYINKNKVDELKRKMKSGIKFDMPYLNYVWDTQEGRHRAKAAIELGVEEIPVLVIKKDEDSESDISLPSKIGVWDDLIKDDYGNFYVTYDLSNYKNTIELLNAVSRDYDISYLDDILSTYLYRNSYPNLLTLVNRNTSLGSINFDIDDVTYFIDRLPSKYKDDLYNTNDEDIDKKLEELILPLSKLAILYILMHNSDIFYDIFSYDKETKTGSLIIDEDLSIGDNYKSGKEMLSKIKLYDDLDFYNIEGDEYYNMDNKFIEKYIDKV